ncbi:uncharacterized protein TM35_000252110 [Trypanosoma theileri]|uniref:Uncharacterized protein n=1 Tax=Trypanosoma theileri TaxID=67003 RepID=A0A1X0NQC7_9TRYP|nr:uncharacterized protein TM35_000252110 [Trypanosoma theileri]ORC86915.1 hypothetical protein TM35_000252110 [Trypanosoma theileri]
MMKNVSIGIKRTREESDISASLSSTPTVSTSVCVPTVEDHYYHNHHNNKEVESSPKRQLRCPWCSDGFLQFPTITTTTASSNGVKEVNNTYNEISGNEALQYLCTNKSSCPHNEVLQKDTSIAFSGIRKEELLNRFYAAMDAHQCCQAIEKMCSAGSIVAEQSPLFMLSVEFSQYEAQAPVFYFFVCDHCGVKEFVC